MHELVGRGSGFEGATPRVNIAATPNPLATPLRSHASDISATPLSSVSGRPGATPLRTPMRDSLSINDGISNVGDTPRQERLRLHELKSQLKQGFIGLPQPKNEFELVLPEDDEVEGDDEVSQAMRIEDATEREAKLKAIRDLEEQKALARRTQVVKRGLPRPVDFDATNFLRHLDLAKDEPALVDDPARSEAERLVAIEMVRLLEHDAIAYPVAGGRRAGGGASTLAFIDDERLAEARAAVHAEMADAVGLPGATDAVLKRAIALDSAEFDKTWRPTYDELAYDAQSRTYVPKSTLSDGDRIAGLAARLDLNRERMSKESAKAAKVEKKLGVTLGGYIARSKVLGGKLSEGYDELARTRIELESFARLATNEEGAMARRTESLREELERLERREREGQGRFRELMDLKMQLVQGIEVMELEEAEALNDAALAAMEE
jgi:pre-mRNA-splicing factor CDC5/CEF1